MVEALWGFLIKFPLGMLPLLFMVHCAERLLLYLERSRGIPPHTQKNFKTYTPYLGITKTANSKGKRDDNQQATRTSRTRTIKQPKQQDQNPTSTYQQTRGRKQASERQGTKQAEDNENQEEDEQ
jgi:hypothetical protein